MNRRVRLFNLLAAALAMSAGLVTLAAYFLRLPVLVALQLALISLASVLAAWAVVAGALNLLLVHTRRLLAGQRGGFYSLFVVLGFALVLVVNLAGSLAGGQGAASPGNRWLYTALISAGSAALAGLVAFFLVFAGYRLLRERPTPLMIIFVVSAVLALVALAPWPSLLPNPAFGGLTLRDALRALTHLPALGGARGLLLGIALGATATGLRVLLGLDRPYGD
jgi:hypothetical protein